MKVVSTGKFEWMLEQLGVHDDKAFLLAQTQIARLRKNPKDSRLEAHPLRKRLKGKLAFRVTDDVRVVFEWLGKNTVRLLAIGGHKKVYSKRR